MDVESPNSTADIQCVVEELFPKLTQKHSQLVNSFLQKKWDAKYLRNPNGSKTSTVEELANEWMSDLPEGLKEVILEHSKLEYQELSRLVSEPSAQTPNPAYLKVITSTYGGFILPHEARNLAREAHFQALKDLLDPAKWTLEEFLGTTGKWRSIPSVKRTLHRILYRTRHKIGSLQELHKNSDPNRLTRREQFQAQ